MIDFLFLLYIFNGYYEKTATLKIKLTINHGFRNFVGWQQREPAGLFIGVLFVASCRTGNLCSVRVWGVSAVPCRPVDPSTTFNIQIGVSVFSSLPTKYFVSPPSFSLHSQQEQSLEQESNMHT
jgi:hypothetical protein